MYDLTQLGENTYCFNCFSNVGIYKLNEKDVCLIDSGDDKSSGKRLMRTLDEKGWNVKAIVNTHSHTDHIFNNQSLIEKYGCKVYANSNDIAFMSDSFLNPAFVCASNPPKEMLTRYYVHQPHYGENLDKANLPLEYIPLPGHTGYMIGIKTPDDVFFVGDCVVDPVTFRKTKIIYIYDIDGFLKSIDKALNVNAKIYVPAHSTPTEDFRSIAEANKNTVNEVAEIVWEKCKTPLSPEELTKAVADRLGYKMGYSQYMTVQSTLKSYLTYLQQQGKAQTYVENNRIYWKSIV